MSRIAIPDLDDVPEASKENLAAAHAQLGVVPNLFRLMGSSPAVLGGYLSFSGALKKTFDVKTRERIALAVAQANGCDYCLSAHSYIATNLAKLTSEEIVQNRNGRSDDARADAAVAFARKVTIEHGHVSEADLAQVRAAGFRDSEIVEIVALVAENIRAGENDGRTLAHRNIVRRLEIVGGWTGTERAYLLPPRRPGLMRAILIQAGTGGPIVAARRLD